MHARQAIVNLVAALLATSPLLATNPIIVGRNYPIDNEELPAVAVYGRTETCRVHVIGAPARQERSLVLQIIAVIKQSDSDDTCNAYALEIERVMFGQFQARFGALDAVLIDLVFQGTAITAHVETERPIRLCELTFTAVYRTPEGFADIVT